MQSSIRIVLDDGVVDLDINLIRKYPSSVIYGYMESNPSVATLELKLFKKAEFDQIALLMDEKISQFDLDPKVYSKAEKIGLTCDILHRFQIFHHEQLIKKLRDIESFIRGESGKLYLVDSNDEFHYETLKNFYQSSKTIMPIQILTVDGTIEMISICGGIPIGFSELTTVENLRQLTSFQKEVNGYFEVDVKRARYDMLMSRKLYRAYRLAYYDDDSDEGSDDFPIPHKEKEEKEEEEKVPNFHEHGFVVHHKLDTNLANFFSRKYTNYHHGVAMLLLHIRYAEEVSGYSYERVENLYPPIRESIPVEMIDSLDNIDKLFYLAREKIDEFRVPHVICYYACDDQGGLHDVTEHRYAQHLGFLNLNVK